MIRCVHVAVAQFASVRDKRVNRQRAREYLTRAADAGAALVVLPEAAMYPFGRPDEPLTAAAEPLDGPFAAELAAAAAATGVTVLAGMFEAVPGDGRIYNTVLAVGPGGPLGRYRKLHLFDALGWRESDRIRAGEFGAAEHGEAGLLTIGVGGLTVGVLTCYDLRFPEQARALVDAGAQVLALPAAWVAGPLKEYHWETLTRARAIENTVYLAAAGQPPPEFSGRSTVLDPMGVALASVGEVDGLAVAEVSAERLADVRRKLPVLEHRRYAVLPRATSLAVP
jgi:predicted amidohydrolase